MKKSLRFISLLCVIAMVFVFVSSTVFNAIAYTMETPLEPSMWETPAFSTDHAYSFAFVGDTQYITCGDYYLGTKKLQAQYKYIADTANERKLSHVFVLGDMTDLGYKNDGNLAGAYYKTPVTGEWTIVRDAVFQLNGKGITYTLCRGNHDDYMMDDYFNVPAYTDQFRGVGGFYSDSNAKWTDHPDVTSSRESDNRNAYIYWSAKSGYHKNSVVNSWMTKEVCGTKYLFMTVDYNPTQNVLDWVNETLEAYPDHKAIITTHSYIGSKGDLIADDSGSTMYHFGNTGKVLWDEALSKHENVFMVVSGHVGVNDIRYSYNVGDHGNKVLQVLVDPQSYDAKEINVNGKIEHGKQDTGLVLYMNFSADGKFVNFDYYSTLLGKFLANTDYTLELDTCAHTWDGGVETKPATVTTKGEMLYTCTKCSKKVNKEISKLGTIDARDFRDKGQMHIYLGDPIEAAKPNSSDGKVSANEYFYSYEITPNSPDTLVSYAGSYTDTQKITSYLSYDSDYLYLAYEVVDKVYVPQKDYFMINLGFDDNGSAIGAVSRLRYDFNGDASAGVLSGNEVGTSVGIFDKLNNGEWYSAKGLVFDNHVPYRSLSWNESTKTLTLEVAFDIKEMLDFWGNMNSLENAVLYYAPIFAMYGNASATSNDKATDQGLLWHYYKNGNKASLKAQFMAAYPETTYWIDWFPHIVHFTHVWDEGVVTTEPTHLTKGEKTFTCLECGEKKYEDVDTVEGVHIPTVIQYDSTYHKVICECGEYEEKVEHLYDNAVNRTCVDCKYVSAPFEGLDGDPGIDKDDAIYLLMHVYFKDRFPVAGSVDYDKSGAVDKDDAIYLLMHVYFPSRFPINDTEPEPDDEDDFWTGDY